MPRKHRLTRREFPARVERRAAGALLSLSMAKNGSTEPKFTCVVPKKLAPRAVDRNRLKRRCREVFAPLLPTLTSVRVVAHPRRAALSAPLAELRAEAARLLRAITR